MVGDHYFDKPRTKRPRALPGVARRALSAVHDLARYKMGGFP